LSLETNPNRIFWIDSQPKQPLCDVPWIGRAVVLSDGRVNFCCYSSAEVGNVNESSFEEIWNGQVMKDIRRALTEQTFPSQCQTTSCPIYRGDELVYIAERMEGPHGFKVSGTHDPHRQIREQLTGTELQVDCVVTHAGDAFNIAVEFHYQGQPFTADLFIGVLYPDGAIHFLPGMEEYAVPFVPALDLRADGSQQRVSIGPQYSARLSAAGEYGICAALFAVDSNPNLLSNCFWSDNKSVTVGKVDRVIT